MTPSLCICIISDLFPPLYSGAGQQAFQIPRQLVRLGHRVLVLTSSAAGLSREEVVEGVRIRRVAPLQPGLAGILTYGLRMAFTLFARRREFDLVHFFSGYKSIYLPLLLLWGLGKPSIINSSMQGGDDLKTIRDSKLGWVRIRLLSLKSIYVSQSPPITGQCKLVYKPPPIFEIPYFVNTGRFYPVSQEQRRRLRKTLLLPEKGVVAAFVGAVGKRKGVDLIVMAWERAARRLPESTLLLIGPRDNYVGGKDINQEFSHNQEFSEWLDEYIQKSGLKNRVRFLQTREVQRYLQASDVFIFPSKMEGLPNAVLEAMACCLPVVTCPADWLADLVEDGVNGVVVNSHPGELAKALLKLADNPELRLKLGQKGRERVLEKYSITAQAKQVISLYHHIIERRGNRKAWGGTRIGKM